MTNSLIFVRTTKIVLKYEEISHFSIEINTSTLIHSISNLALKTNLEPFFQLRH